MEIDGAEVSTGIETIDADEGGEVGGGEVGGFGRAPLWRFLRLSIPRRVGKSCLDFLLTIPAATWSHVESAITSTYIQRSNLMVALQRN